MLIISLKILVLLASVIAWNALELINAQLAKKDIHIKIANVFQTVQLDNFIIIIHMNVWLAQRDAIHASQLLTAQFV